MCGIAGFIGKTNEWKDEIVRMCTRMKHRGPDAEGFWSDENTEVVLGHRRLSILDISENGKQPMLSGNGRYVISYNGEIYNYKEIARELNKSNPNIKMKTKTDTEVLLEAISEWGIKSTLQKARGAFAFVLFDRKTDLLYLARDRMGEKPLYYGHVNGRFIFASELSCIEQLNGFNAKIDPFAMKLFFEHGYIPAPYSIYENIFKLEPGEILSVNHKGEIVEYKKYWSVEDVAISGKKNPFTGTEEEATAELKRLLKKSIQKQMIADVPVGAFLSAGIDSSTVVSLMQDMSKRPVKTFTIGVESEKNNEAIIAKEIAGILGTDHTELYVSDNEAQSVIPKLGYYYSEPFADSSQIPMMLVSELAKKQVTVSLSGDGGDELLAGYNYYEYIDTVWKQIMQFPRLVRKILKYAYHSMPVLSRNHFFSRGEFLRCSSPEDLYNWSRKKAFKDGVFTRKIMALSKNDMCTRWLFDEYQQNIMLLDLQMYHPDDILVKVDRAAMAYSLETRIPLLDANVIEFAWTLPFNYKKSGGITKRVLRNILYEYIPRELVERPKTGFTIPINEWLSKGKIKQWADELIFGKDLDKVDGLIDLSKIRRLWIHHSTDGAWTETMWRVLMFTEWMKGRHVNV